MDRFGGGGRGGGPPGGAGGGRGGFNRQAAVKALKESVQTGHKTGLPPPLLVLFQARPPLPEITAIKKRKPAVPYKGLADLVSEFATPGEPEYEPPRLEDRPASPRLFRNREFPTQARIDSETRAEKKIRISKWKVEEAERQVKEASKSFDPNKDSRIEGDPYKTIMVARMSYDVTEKKLKKEFEEYGPIKRVRIVMDKNGKSRGYGFIEYEHKKDMKEAYKLGDGKKIEGRRVLLDVERGRTVENWRPRRLGGGLGGPGREPKQPKKAGGAAIAAGPGLGPPMDMDRRRDDPRDRERERSPIRRRDEPPPRRREDEPPARRREDDRPPRRDEPPARREEPPRERERDRIEREQRDRERDRDTTRKREREASPRREREREPRDAPERDDKRRRGPEVLEDGEVRDSRPSGGGDRRDRDRDRPPRRERDAF